MSEFKFKLIVLVYIIAVFQLGYWSGYFVGRG